MTKGNYIFIILTAPAFKTTPFSGQKVKKSSIITKVATNAGVYLLLGLKTDVQLIGPLEWLLGLLKWADSIGRTGLDCTK